MWRHICFIHVHFSIIIIASRMPRWDNVAVKRRVSTWFHAKSWSNTCRVTTYFIYTDLYSPSDSDRNQKICLLRSTCYFGFIVVQILYLIATNRWWWWIVSLNLHSPHTRGRSRYCSWGSFDSRWSWTGILCPFMWNYPRYEPSSAQTDQHVLAAAKLKPRYQFLRLRMKQTFLTYINSHIS